LQDHKANHLLEMDELQSRKLSKNLKKTMIESDIEHDQKEHGPKEKQD